MCLFLKRERDLPPRGAVLGLPWTLCWRSWAAPGTYAAGLGALLGLCCRSWAALGPYVEGLGPLLGPLLAVLGCLGPKSGPGPSGKAIWQADLGRKVALARAGRRSGNRIWAESAPNPSGRGIQQEPGRDRSERRARWDRRARRARSDRSGGPVPMFSIDI